MSDTENQVIAALAEQTADPVEIVTGRAGDRAVDLYAFMRRAEQQLELVDLAQYAPTPDRKKGQVTLTDAASFSTYINRHADATTTTLWGDVSRARIIAVFDDHSTGTEAGWGQHRALLGLQLTEDWAHWTARDGQMMAQAAFAAHLEDGAAAVVSPDAATLLEVAQSFHAKNNVAFRSAARLDSGEVQFLYEENVTAKAGQKGELAVPASFELGLAPFEGGEAQRIVARFRYRLSEGRITLGYKLTRPDQVLRAAFDEITANIAKAVALPVLAGSPR